MEIKNEYKTPQIERVRLDDEISLHLESVPPAGPDETNATTPDYFNNHPLKFKMA